MASWACSAGARPQRLAQLAELVIFCGLASARSEQPARELFVVVRENVADLERGSFTHCRQDGFGHGRRLVRLDGTEHPAGRPVDSDEHIAALVLTLHLGQVLHIHMHVTRLIGSICSTSQLCGKDTCFLAVNHPGPDA